MQQFVNVLPLHCISLVLSNPHPHTHPDPFDVSHFFLAKYYTYEWWSGL